MHNKSALKQYLHSNVQQMLLHVSALTKPSSGSLQSVLR